MLSAITLNLHLRTTSTNCTVNVCNTLMSEESKMFIKTQNTPAVENGQL